MPRPPFKRRRSNQQTSNTAKHTSPKGGLQPNPRVKLQQRLAKKSIGQRQHDSDDSDRLVTRRQSGRNIRNEEPIFASGGVAKGDKPGMLPTKEERQRRLRSDTEEIIRRSRSKSIEARKEKLAKSRSNSVISSNVDGTSSPIPNMQVSSNEPPQSALPKPQPTPMSERSLLGTLKPRRGRASILNLVENNDSSAINSEDEEQFLPDDESTPLNSRNEATSKNTNQAPTNTPKSSSRKRKFGADSPLHVASGTSSISSGPRPGSSASNHINLPVSTRRKSTPVIDDDDIMAPPQSSSPESSPQNPSITSNKPTKSARAPTTEQLQSMMPSKRRKGTRDRVFRSEFDIPEDSSSNEANVEDESIYNPRKRTTTKSRSRKEPSTTSQNPTSKAKAKAPPKLQTKKIVTASAAAAAATATATPASKSKQSQKSTSTPLTVTSPRTPLPLTRNTNQENKTLPKQPRNRSSKANGAGENAPDKDKRPEYAYGKSSGGSRPRRGLRGATNIDVAIDTAAGTGSDKENSGYTRTRPSRKRALPSKPIPNPVEVMDVDEPQPSIELATATATANVEDEDEDENEADEADEADGIVSTGRDEVEVFQSPVATKASSDARAWKDKWGDIDAWDLAFEEVDVSTGSSSPLLKASVV